MRVRRSIILVSVLIGGLLLLGAGDAPAGGDRTANPPCEPLYEHMMGLFMQNPEFAAEWGKMTPEEEAGKKAEFVSMCGGVTDPGEIEISWCIMDATTFEGLEACLASKKESIARRIARADALANLDGIRTAELAYVAEFDAFQPCDWTPAEIPAAPVNFDGPGKAAFDALGWSPFGQVLCRYRVTVKPGGKRPVTTTFEATAECDLDGDGTPMVLRSTDAEKAAAVTPDDVF